MYIFETKLLPNFIPYKMWQAGCLHINEFKKKFYMAHNIGGDFTDKNYDNILSQLKSSDSISVWIRHRDLESYQPKFFQINN